LVFISGNNSTIGSGNETNQGLSEQEQKKISIFIKIDISKPSLIQHFKKKISNIINIEQKSGNYATL
jgi:hypothetical protein